MIETHGINRLRVGMPDWARMRSWEQGIVWASFAVLFLHLLDDAFVHPEPMTSTSDNIVTGILGAAFVVLLAAVYPHLGTAARGSVSLAAGLYALWFGLGIHVPHAVSIGTGGADYTGFAMVGAGVLLTGVGLWQLGRALPNAWWRAGMIPAGFVFLIVIFLPVLLAVGVTNTARVPISGDTPADRGFEYEDVTYETEDGLTIAGWYIPSQNGAAVIAVHGAGKNRTKTLDHAVLFAENGYGVLMIDLRGYGESEGNVNSMGWNGARDIPGAVAYLEARPDVDAGRVGGVGLSMGGEVLLQAAGSGAGLAAVVSEGAGARTYEEVLEMEDNPVVVLAPPLFVRETAIELLTGVGMPHSNKEMVANFAPNPTMLIAGEIGEEVEWNGILQETSGGSAVLWEAEGGHIDSFATDPEEYESRVIGFLDEALLGEAD